MFIQGLLDRFRAWKNAGEKSFKFIPPVEGDRCIMTNIKQMLHTIGFWFLICIIIGISIGGYGMYKVQKWQMDNAVKVGAFVFDKKVFELKERM